VQSIEALVALASYGSKAAEKHGSTILRILHHPNAATLLTKIGVDRESLQCLYLGPVRTAMQLHDWHVYQKEAPCLAEDAEEDGSSCDGDWTSHHAKLQYIPGTHQIDLNSLAPPSEVEKLCNGKWAVVPLHREEGQPVRFAAGSQGTKDNLQRAAQGRISPLNMPRGRSGTPQGVNGVVFAIESTGSAGESARATSQ